MKTETTENREYNRINYLDLYSFAWTLLYAALTFKLLYYTRPRIPTTLSRLSMLILTALPTIWLYRRIAKVFEEPYPGLSHLDLLKSFSKHSLRPCSVSSGMFAGGLIASQVSTDPTIGWLFGGLLCSINLKFLFSDKADKHATRVLRGSTIMNMRQAKQHAFNIITKDEPLLVWAGLPFPERFSSEHFCIIGATKSGKTITLRLLMQSVLPGICPGSESRAVLFDAKGDLFSILAGMPLQCKVLLFHPYDARSCGWLMGKDVTSFSIALQVASIIVEKETGDNNSFFTKAARDLFAGVMQALIITRPGNWSFADLLRILSNSEQIESLLRSVPQTRHIADEHFSRNSRTLSSVLYTISANIAMLRPIAALWEKSSHQISLTDWVESESILVLGNQENLRAPLDAVNRVLLQRIVELLLAQSESDTRRNWFFLDELKEGGKFDLLDRLLTKGRSKGCRAALAWQTMEGLMNTYGEKTAREIEGMCASKCLLRTDSHFTAEYCSKVIGQSQLKRWTRTDNMNQTSMGEQIVIEEAVLASELMQLPLADRKRYYGYFISPAIGTFAGTVHFDEALCPRGDEPDFIPRPAEDQILSVDQPNTDTIRSPRVSLDDIRRLTRRTPRHEVSDSNNNIII